jgi:4'-phosphopantetheinyl transferase
MTQEEIWVPAAPGVHLSSNEVHIWRTRLDVDFAILSSYATFLSTDEQQRAVQFKFTRDRDHFTVARAILRQLLGGYLGQPPAEVPIESLRYGKPALAAAKIPPLRFNLSHSHGLALFAFCFEHEIGIDLEKIRPEVALEGIENNFFSTRERDELAALSLELRAGGFFHCWTRKEAYVKALGGGLNMNLQEFDVSLTPGQPVTLNSSDRQRWSLYSLEPGAGFVGALVVEGRDHRVRCWDL